MTDKIATVAFVVQDDPCVIQKWVDSRPLTLEIVQIVREDAGLKIVTAAEMVTLVEGLYANLTGSTRRKLRVFYRQQRSKSNNTKEATP